jgi:hypothetical protein
LRTKRIRASTEAVYFELEAVDMEFDPTGVKDVLAAIE